jgi:hypothetical protein
MNAAGLSSTTPDTRLHALLQRGLAQARAREATTTTAEAAPESVEAPPPATPRSLGLASDRACVESNLARKALWRSGTGAGGGELVRLLDATDQLGMVQGIDAGPPLGALSFDVIVWACSRWRELGEVGERHVPFTLDAIAADLGWRKGGAAAELARALDTLRSATFRARVYNARLGETRIDTFGLIDRWERGEPDRSGRPARAGFLVLGDWLHEQLARKHVTFVSWSELRALSSGTTRRLLVSLEAERFTGRTWRRTIDDTLLTTLGIVAAKPVHQRATVRRAAEKVTRADNRYASVRVELGERRGVHVLTAPSARHGGRRVTGAVAAMQPGQSLRCSLRE